MPRFKHLDGIYSSSQTLWGIISQLTEMRSTLDELSDFDAPLRHRSSFHHAFIKIEELQHELSELRHVASRIPLNSCYPDSDIKYECEDLPFE